MKAVFAAIAAATLAALPGAAAHAQAYPSKPIRIHTVAQGGSVDTVIRIIAQGIEKPLGQPVVIENKPSTVFPQDAVAKATPDGYLFVYIANQLWLGPFLRADMPHDPLTDFSPVSLTVKGPNTVLVSSSLPVKNVQELVALVKSRPKDFNLGWAALGSSPHLAGLLFQNMTGAQFTDVRYKGLAQAVTDLVAGRIHVVFPTISTGAGAIKTGKAKVLAVTSYEAFPQLPDVPTVASSGYPDYESVAIQALLGPKGVPEAMVNRVNQEVVRLLRQPETSAKLNAIGFNVVASSPAQLAAAMKSEMDRMGPVMRAAGIKPGDAAGD